jgi:hypothetical protein
MAEPLLPVVFEWRKPHKRDGFDLVDKVIEGATAPELVLLHHGRHAFDSYEPLTDETVWLTAKRALVLPKSQLGEAVGYALSNWDALMRYTQQGYLSIHNNLSERALRQVVVGRANWLFCGSTEGGRTVAARGRTASIWMARTC